MNKKDRQLVEEWLEKTGMKIREKMKGNFEKIILIMHSSRFFPSSSPLDQRDDQKRNTFFDSLNFFLNLRGICRFKIYILSSKFLIFSRSLFLFLSLLLFSTTLFKTIFLFVRFFSPKLYSSLKDST